jgi:DNA-binding transcriptional MerR regulator
MLTSGVSRELSLTELAREVQNWCGQHNIIPANGQAAEEISERNIRYYRTLGLLDPPLGHYPKTFSDKHRLQLIAIRIFQAQGLPLRKIRDELYGKSLEDLVALEKQVGKRGARALSLAVPFQPPTAGESWSVLPLGDDFLLVSRRHRELPRTVIEQISKILRSIGPENENVTENKRN